ncbi:MAG: hypothetical protein KBB11_11720 [Bacteroidales bacterium]|nr:hypothetical protein [Bacteroidales bacterium]HOY39135.1 hypothetical protein [Bacteroidales bacterium]
MKKLFYLMMILAATSVVLTSCDPEDDIPDDETITITGNITANTIWETGNTYILGGRITVVSGITLTIEPGVIVKGQAGTGSNATALIIARGATINAQGTEAQPIIFTSVADEIEPGMIASPNLDTDLNGLWGGLIILGNAPISASGESVQIEGIPASDQNGLYGGNNATDNSGIIRYVSIRHGGANIGEGNEINGLTLGGVGSGTTVEYVEVVANQDDGVEFFGGTVNVNNLIIWNPCDDGVDTDQSWAGTLDNFIVIAGAETDHTLEIDGPEGSMLAAHTLENGSIKGSESAELGDFRSGARGTFQNLHFFNFPDPATTDGRGDLSLSGDATLANFASGVLTFSNLQVTPATGVAVNSIFKNGTDVHASSVNAGANTVGADKTKFASWTWVSTNNELGDF